METIWKWRWLGNLKNLRVPNLMTNVDYVRNMVIGRTAVPITKKDRAEMIIKEDIDQGLVPPVHLKVIEESKSIKNLGKRKEEVEDHLHLTVVHLLLHHLRLLFHQEGTYFPNPVVTTRKERWVNVKIREVKKKNDDPLQFDTWLIIMTTQPGPLKLCFWSLSQSLPWSIPSFPINTLWLWHSNPWMCLSQWPNNAVPSSAIKKKEPFTSSIQNGY